MTRIHWNAAHGAKAEAEVSWFQADVGAEVQLIREHARPDQALIDIGAGRSRVVDALLNAGFSDVTLLDVSDVALANVKARLGARSQVALIRADVTKWRPQRAYQLWHDRAALHFLTGEADRTAYRAALIAATRSGSVGIFSTFAPDGPERCSGLTVRRYGAEEMAGFLGPEFRTLADRPTEHSTPTGAIQRFHLHVARREAP